MTWKYYLKTFHIYSLNLKGVADIHFNLPSSVIISNTALERKYEARFGVIIDASLNWTRHLKIVLSKMSRYVGIMYTIKEF